MLHQYTPIPQPLPHKKKEQMNFTDKIKQSTIALSQLANDPMPTYGKLIVRITLAFWLLMVVGVAFHHEMWRDEVRAFLMATEPNSFLDLFSTLRNEGHPVLWYAILRLAYLVFKTPVVLQLTSILIAFAAVTLFMKHSPFPLLVKFLFVFGVIPFVEYSVYSRNYGISMLLFFLLAYVYGRPDRKNWHIGVLIALLANTNYLALVFSVLITGWWVLDSRSTLAGENKKTFIASALLAIFGILVSYLTMAMDANSSQATPEFVYSINYLHHLLLAIQHPGQHIRSLFNPPAIIGDLAVIGLLLGLLARPLLFLTLLAAFLAFNILAGAILTPQARHQGVLYIFIVMVYWIAMTQIKAQTRTTGFDKIGKVLLYSVLYLILVPFMALNVSYAKGKIAEDLSRELSSSKAFGAFINTNFQFRNAIVIGEPDYLIQSLPYYAKNRIYIVREKRFGGYIRYIKGFPKLISLSDILQAAEMLTQKYEVPVLIALKHWPMAQQDTYVKAHPYGRGFKTNIQEIRRFSQRTIKVAEFNNALCDENYRVFLVPKSRDLDRYREKYGQLTYQLDALD